MRTIYSVEDRVLGVYVTAVVLHVQASRSSSSRFSWDLQG